MSDQSITRIASKRIQIEFVQQPEYKSFFRAIVFNVYSDAPEEVIEIYEGNLKWVTTMACIMAASHLDVSVDAMHYEYHLDALVDADA